MEEQTYLEWLVDIYQRRTGIKLELRKEISQALALLWRYRVSGRGNSDFVSMVTLRMAEQLNSKEVADFPSFYEMFRRAADAERHSLARKIRKWATAGPVALDSLQDREANQRKFESLVREICASLTLEESHLMSEYMDSKSIDKVAAQLAISPRTVKRRLKSLREKLYSKWVRP